MRVNRVVAVIAIMAFVEGSSPVDCNDSGTCVSTDAGSSEQKHIGTKLKFEEGSEALLQTRATRTKAASVNELQASVASYRPKAGSLVFDIGAADGSSATEFRREWDAHVLAVDANYGFFNSYLKPQLANGKDAKGYTVLQAAMSDTDGDEATFYKACDDYLSSMRKEWLTNSTKFRYGKQNCFEETKVTTRTLDALIEEYGSPSYIKVDTEGFEETVLKGLTKRVPLVSFEWSYPDTFLDSHRALERLRDTVGFKSWALMFGDAPFSHIPKDFEFQCLEELTEDKLKETMSKPPPGWSSKEGPVGMIFVAAELPLGGSCSSLKPVASH
eukprot:gnl/TRDRNA2_/TRDRNA2_172000_c1_seq1.p1 gnl/TRDRNA2_/TRDRNA2_172000_c1~~gnl/TRDRNA2_/TRDRNA2_172000_c1_seq1.p1  ORF type:complete len:354 (-),score=63.55 gnl/TRDRNA2_/TRDRNA2_172000_c1_seq1:87-1073(-)